MLAPLKRIHLIINPASGPDRAVLQIANRVFRRHNIEWDVAITHQVGDGGKCAREALSREDVDMVIAYGGDGTVMDVVNGLFGSSMPLGILVGGTGNAVADELNISHDLETALETLCAGRGQLQQMDVGKIDDTYFLLRADTGLSTEVMAQTTRELKQRFGVLAYFITLARTMSGHPLKINYRISVDGCLIECQGAACIITNISSVGTAGMKLGESVKFDDGLFDIFVLSADLRSILSIAASAMVLTSLEYALQHWQGREILLETDIPQPMGIDGNPYRQTPFNVTVIPRAIQVFVPSPRPSF
jgi:YegS/Rv2252/BmrU family lipid kinase